MKAENKVIKLGLTSNTENILRITKPKLGWKTDYKRSRTAAIQLFCLTCMGGSKSDVTKCTSYNCPLWQFRPGAKKNIKPGGIPTEDQYRQLMDAKVSVKQRAQGKKLGNSKS